MNQFTVSPDFKARVAEILGKKKFTQVFPFMNLINREGFSYTETELNQIIQFVGDFSYNEVAEFFTLIPTLVKEVNGVEPPAPIPGVETPEDQQSPTAEETASN